MEHAQLPLVQPAFVVLQSPVKLHGCPNSTTVKKTRIWVEPMDAPRDITITGWKMYTKVTGSDWNFARDRSIVSNNI